MGNRHGFKGYSAGDRVYCDACGAIMKEVGEGRFECTKCVNIRFRRDDGSLENLDDHMSGGKGTCSVCGASLKGCERVPAWSDGENSLPYTICRKCNHKNF